MNKLTYILFVLGLFFFSFNSFEGIQIFGEFSNEAAFYFFTAGSIITFSTTKFEIPYQNRIFQIIILFTVWCFISTVLNFSSVITNFLKYTTGVSRFIRQFFVLVLCVIIYLIYFYNIYSRFSLEKLFFLLRRIFVFSLLVVFVFGFFETLYGYFGIYIFKNIVDLFNYFPFIERTFFSERIASVGDEPPILAIYLITIFAWMFSYILTSTSKFLKYVPLCLVYFLTFFSGSRTALIIIVIQSLFFIFKVIRLKDFLFFFKRYVPLIMTIILISLFINSGKIYTAISEKIESLNFTDNLTKNISNQSRFGMQHAAMEVFKENPIIGVGFGQQAYHTRYKYPAWAKKNNYEFEYFYQNTSVRAFPPAYNIYTRLLAEVGLIGVIILASVIFLSLRDSKKLIITTNDSVIYLYGIVIHVSLIGLYINWFQNDSFKIFGIWLYLALLVRVQMENQKLKND